MLTPTDVQGTVLCPHQLQRFAHPHLSVSCWPCQVPLVATGCVKLDIASAAEGTPQAGLPDKLSYKAQLVSSAHMAARRYPQHWLQVSPVTSSLLLSYVA